MNRPQLIQNIIPGGSTLLLQIQLDSPTMILQCSEEARVELAEEEVGEFKECILGKSGQLRPGHQTYETNLL